MSKVPLNENIALTSKERHGIKALKTSKTKIDNSISEIKKKLRERRPPMLGKHHSLKQTEESQAEQLNCHFVEIMFVVYNHKTTILLRSNR